MQLMGATHGNTTSDEFDGVVRDWLATAKHPTTERLYTEMAYQPMIELLAYLRSNGFKTFIASGGGVDFMRGFAERVYGIPPEQVIGSTGEVKFELRDGKPVLLRLPALTLRRQGGQADRHLAADRPPADRRVRQFGRRPADAAVDVRGAARATASSFATPTPAEWAYDMSPMGVLEKGLQEARRERLDGGGHEEGLEHHLPVPEEVAGRLFSRLVVVDADVTRRL